MAIRCSPNGGTNNYLIVGEDTLAGLIEAVRKDFGDVSLDQLVVSPTHLNDDDTGAPFSFAVRTAN